MGIIIGKFRKKKSTYDTLEKLEQEITYIEEFGKSTEQTKKKIIGRFILLAILVYLILAFALYIYYHKICANQSLLCATPLIAFPVIIWVVKCFLTWYYTRKISKNKKKLVSLKDEKKKILDNVMETETYKVAKKILDKFGNELNKKPLMFSTLESTPVPDKAGVIVPTTLRGNQTGLRRRTIGPPTMLRERVSLGATQTPFHGRQLIQMSTPSPGRTVTSLPVVPRAGPVPGTPLPLPRSILPRDRSVLERMLDMLVGDGPSNRYALICKKCNSHNGMALKEEFEYLSFRCCYCSAFNPARKKKPTGPTFATNISPTRPLLSPNSSDSDKNSMSDSDTDTKPTEIMELRTDSPDTGKNSDFDKLSDLDQKVSDSEAQTAPVDQPVVEELSPDIPMEVCDSYETEEPAEVLPIEADTEKKPESETETLVG